MLSVAFGDVPSHAFKSYYIKSGFDMAPTNCGCKWIIY